MSPILIAGLVLVCIVLFYFFDIFGVKKWADKTFGKKTADKFGSFCKPGEILSTKLKSDKDGYLLQYNCHDKTGKLTKSEEHHIIPHPSSGISDGVRRVDPSNWNTNLVPHYNPDDYGRERW